MMLAADALGEVGTLQDFSLVLHGTKESPYLTQSGGDRNRKLQAVKRLHANIKAS